ncbi:hypothetical protein UT300016_31520 [Clostridium senegalense]
MHMEKKNSLNNLLLKVSSIKYTNIHKKGSGLLVGVYKYLHFLTKYNLC